MAQALRQSIRKAVVDGADAVGELLGGFGVGLADVERARELRQSLITQALERMKKLAAGRLTADATGMASLSGAVEQSRERASRASLAQSSQRTAALLEKETARFAEEHRIQRHLGLPRNIGQQTRGASERVGRSNQ